MIYCHIAPLHYVGRAPEKAAAILPIIHPGGPIGPLRWSWTIFILLGVQHDRGAAFSQLILNICRASNSGTKKTVVSLYLS